PSDRCGAEYDRAPFHAATASTVFRDGSRHRSVKVGRTAVHEVRDRPRRVIPGLIIDSREGHVGKVLVKKREGITLKKRLLGLVRLAIPHNVSDFSRVISIGLIEAN